MSADPDSALALLGGIDPDELTVDSIKAKYHYVMAYAHDSRSHLSLADSLVSFSCDFYRGRDLRRSINSTSLFAAYKFRIGEREVAIEMLDSLSSLTSVPESLLIEPLRAMVDLGAYDGPNESRIKRLISIDNDSGWLQQYKYWLYIDHLYSNKHDEAVALLDEFIADAVKEGDADQKFRYEYEKVGALEESGRYAESLKLGEKLQNEPLGNEVCHYLHMWRSLALLNMGRYPEATKELAKADSLALAISKDERGYFNSFANTIASTLDYQTSGRLSLMSMAKVSNSQKDYLRRTQSIRREAEQSALEIENQRLLLKAKNDRQTALLVIVVLAALLVSGALAVYARNRKRKALEMLERNEILQKLVDESKAPRADSSANEALRRAMLKQLGIIKMVAETPTEQNRDMLRKISSIDGDTDGTLVNWQSVYGMIDNLYGGFYSRLRERHGNLLSPKEEQIIALMVAGFSTKEISVITGQTVATIYVRKSSVRKKLGVPEKEDIVAFLRREGGL